MQVLRTVWFEVQYTVLLLMANACPVYQQLSRSRWPCYVYLGHGDLVSTYVGQVEGRLSVMCVSWQTMCCWRWRLKVIWGHWQRGDVNSSRTQASHVPSMTLSDLLWPCMTLYDLCLGVVSLLGDCHHLEFLDVKWPWMTLGMLTLNELICPCVSLLSFFDLCDLVWPCMTSCDLMCRWMTLYDLCLGVMSLLDACHHLEFLDVTSCFHVIKWPWMTFGMLALNELVCPCVSLLSFFDLVWLCDPVWLRMTLFTDTRDSRPLQDGIKDLSSLHPVTVTNC